MNLKDINLKEINFKDMTVKQKVAVFSFVLLLLVTTFGLLISFFMSDDDSDQKISGISIMDIDSEVRPQDDFYHFANGVWLDDIDLDDEEMFVDIFSKLKQQALMDVKALAEEQIEADKWPEVLQKKYQQLHQLYLSFMNQDVRDTLDFQVLQKELDEIDKIKNHRHIFTYFARLHMLGAKTPILAYVAVDEKVTSRYRLHLWQSGLELPDRDFYLSQQQKFIDLRISYLSYMEAVFNELGSTHPDEDAKAVLTLEMRLATTHVKSKANQEPSDLYHVLSLKQLNQQMPRIDWKRYFSQLGVPQTDKVIMSQPSYFKALQKSINQISISDWKVYLKWKLVNAYAPYLQREVAQRYYRFYEIDVLEHKEEKPDWQRAVEMINEMMGETAGQVYAQAYGDKQAISMVEEMVRKIKQAYIKRLRKISWLTPQTRKKAQQKISSLTYQIGYPTKSQDNADLALDETTLVENIKLLHQAEFKKQLALLKRSHKSEDWLMKPQEVELYYLPTKNEVICPMALLRPPLFHTQVEAAANYGAIGTLLTRQISYSLGFQGASFREKGHLRKWWSKQDYKKFNKMRKPLIAQYNNFSPLPDTQVNGQATLDENTIDVMAVTISYLAYQDAEIEHKGGSIDGFNAEERFFLSYAQMWRRKEQESYLKQHLLFDRYAPAKYRVNGVLSHVDAFYQTFDVRKKDQLFLPKDKRIKLW
tara:strand:- start:2534 stop:4645 length:2112 start_codon:yes stop_codon:yes gene_type:complete